MTKERMWILARLEGLSDQEARERAGYIGCPSGKSYKLLDACLLLLQQPPKRREELSLYYEQKVKDLRTELKTVETLAKAARMCPTENRSEK